MPIGQGRIRPEFLRNLFRKNAPATAPGPGRWLVDLARAEAPLGDPGLSEAELAVTVAAFETTGFTGSIDWYPNLDLNWHVLAETEPIVHRPALMIEGDREPVAAAARRGCRRRRPAGRCAARAARSRGAASRTPA